MKIDCHIFKSSNRQIFKSSKNNAFIKRDLRKRVRVLFFCKNLANGEQAKNPNNPVNQTNPINPDSDKREAFVTTPNPNQSKKSNKSKFRQK